MDGIALADTDAGILFDCNQALAALVGRNRAELIGQPQTILHPPASDSSAFSPTFKLHATTREGQVLETQVITATGEIREVEIKASLLYLQGKKMMQGIFHDITERKRAEEALRGSEERYRLIAENMTETVWLMDMNLKPTYISPSAVPLRGYTLEELYALPLDRQLTPDSLKLAWETFKEALSEENLNSKDAPTSITLELEFYRKNGSTFWNESTFTLARNSKGEPAGILGVGREITERKRLESELKRYSEHLEEEVLERTKKLAESESRFREMADLLPQPVFEMDEKGNITFLNRAGFETTGYDEDDLKAGLNAFQVIARESHKLAREEIGRILSGESSPGNEYVFVRKDGSQLPVISHASSILKGGKVVGLRGVIIDITERKRIEDSLRESAEKYRDLFENANDLVQCVDGDGRFALVNRKWLETLGYSREALKQLTLMDILRKDQVPHCMELFGRVRNGEVLDNVETVFLSKDGREILVEGNVNGQFKDGQFVTTRGIFRDVTERKRMEEALRESEERLETIFDSVRTGIMIIDSKTHLIVDANPAATEMAGAPKEQIVGSVCHKYVCPAEKGRCPITDLGQTVDNAERVFLRVNGKTTPVMKSVRRIVLGGQEHLLESFIDITEHKKLEAQLAESQRLAGIGEAAAMVGHDLRNPLQGIASTIYLAKRKLESPPEPSREAAVKPGLVDMLETIENEAKYMDKIVSDLQDYAAPLKTDPKPVEMEPLVKDMLSKMRIPQNVKVSSKVSKPLPTVMIDPAVMRRVFSNLIMNAIQAMPDGGELEIDLYGTDEFLFVAFKDTGVGMPEENMGELFNPFFTTKAKGQGLGLAVCKRLVEAHNGRITVESKPGEGSTFTVKLPIIKP
jgi:PAS domain S-box-containing protein